ncbi:MAG: sigma-70 family RNA polymerase sigma factor [Phycisphaerales bacterium]|nr:MAG: sigma-70 family RNA polymerase sigma factor [Phycisphaerales bacterium]
MLEDRYLVWRLRQGRREALRRIYDRYKDDLLRLAVSLSNETTMAEDVVQDVFVAFIGSVDRFRLTGSLKGYLATCVANRVRNANRDRRRHQHVGLDAARQIVAQSKRPDQWVICSEELERVAGALALLSDEQREVIALRLQGALKFREIAAFQGVPIKTALSRYRCGLGKLRSMLNGEVT